jgi:Bacterial regulatory protein, Fis family.
LRVLLEWDYPGNVRQLEGIIERAVALSDGRYIDVSDIRQVDGYRQDTKEYEIYDSGMTLKDIELKAIKEALEITDNNKTRASKLLGIDRTTLWRRLRKLEK